jgi:hypothetical protein
MTPRDLDNLSPAELDALDRYMTREIKARERENRRARRRR